MNHLEAIAPRSDPVSFLTSCGFGWPQNCHQGIVLSRKTTLLRHYPIPYPEE
ncbi:MAG: hypothetical protein K6T90_22715 [Leptolyngbyaceae cyanobacterium HOT.MB2.61]|nr:hypothetical protein [Leptolyngbyaceae cyanobacterium HOT.MB2.61]